MSKHKQKVTIKYIEAKLLMRGMQLGVRLETKIATTYCYNVILHRKIQ